MPTPSSVRRLVTPSSKPRTRSSPPTTHPPSTDDQVTQILDILGEALENDNPIRIITGGSPDAYAAYLRLLVESAIARGEVHVASLDPDAEQFDGVALWAPPGLDWTACKNKDYQRLLRPEVLEWLLYHAIPTYDGLYRSAFGPQGYDVSVKSWHLKMLAVRPSAQKQGIARALVSQVADKIEGDYSIVTDCHTQVSIRFFQKLGFRHQSVKNYYNPFGVGFPMWCMLRESTSYAPS